MEALKKGFELRLYICGHFSIGYQINIFLLILFSDYDVVASWDELLSLDFSKVL